MNGSCWVHKQLSWPESKIGNREPKSTFEQQLNKQHHQHKQTHLLNEVKLKSFNV